MLRLVRRDSGPYWSKFQTHFFTNIDNLNFLSGGSCLTFQYGHNAIVFVANQVNLKI